MYNAFISYSHAGDGKLAPALQNALEKFAKPWYKLRNLNIFRDEASLTASPHLWRNIQSALARSEYLIYLASPTSANSKWINKEIQFWLENKSLEKLLIVLTDGEIIWDDSNNFFKDPEVNSLPTVLENKFTEEPFYIDLRNSRTQKDLSLNNPIFKKEVLKLAAHLHGKEPKDLASEEVSAYNKTIQFRNGAIATLILFLIAAVWSAWFANNKRIEANARTIEARVSKAMADSSAKVAVLQSKIAKEQRDSAIIARREADLSAIVAKFQKDTAQLERDNAIRQQQIALREKQIAQSNYLLSEAKSAAESDPTLALRLASSAIMLHESQFSEAAAYKIYRENSFYKILGKHNRGITSISVSGDGQQILSVSKDSMVKVCSLNGKLILNFRDKSQLYCAEFSPDGNFILTGARDGFARLWNRRQQLVTEFPVQSYVEDVAFSPDGKFIATASFDSIVRIWDLKGNLIRRITGHTDQVTSVCFSPDGSKLLSGSYDGTARLCDRDGRLLQNFAANSVIYSVAYSPDGRSIVTGSRDNTARLWTIDGKLLRELRGHSDAVITTSFSSGGDLVLTGSWDKTAALWDTAGSMLESLKGDPGMVMAEFANNGNNIATAGGESASMYTNPGDHTIRLWGIKNACKAVRNSSPVMALALSSSEENIVTAGSDNTIRVFNKKHELVRSWKAHSGRIMDLCISADGNYIVSASLDSSATVWSSDGKLISHLKGHSGSISTVKFSPDGSLILTSSEDKTARLWDLKGNLKQQLAHATAVRAAVFSDNGKWILTGTSSFGEVARLWRINGELVREFYDYTYSLTYVTALAFSPDCKSFVAGTADYKARLWSVNGKLITELAGHSAAITVVNFFADGKNIVTGSKDGTARIWDLRGNTIQELKGHKNVVSCLDVSKDIRSVITGSFDGSMRIWKVPLPLPAFLESAAIEELSSDQKSQYGIR